MNYKYVSNRDTCITNVHMHTPYPEGTLLYENLHRINYSNLVQNHQIHGMKYWQILICEIHLYKAIIGSHFL